MLRFLPIFLFLALVGSTAAQPKPDESPVVTIQFLGGSKKVPLEGLKVVALRGDSWADREKVAEGTTDKDGYVSFSLGLGYHYIELTSPKEIPYLWLPVGYHDHPNWYTRSITLKRNSEQSFTFNLADACKMTLRAVDADTGKAIPDIEFVTENALGEVWGQAINPENLGAKPIGENDARQKTDAQGNFVRLMGPKPGYTYYPWTGTYKVPPENTSEHNRAVGEFEVEVPTPIGTATVEHVWKLRKKAK